jgi:hypothetical protein
MTIEDKPTTPRGDLTEPVWERQPDEPSRAYAAFVRYRDMGPQQRSFAAVGRAVHGARTGRKRGATGRVAAWASRWCWRERAQAWDDHCYAEASVAKIDAVRKMNERHELQLRAAFNVVIRRAAKIDPAELTVAQVFLFTEKLIHLERLVHGQPILIEAHQHTGTGGEGPVPTLTPLPEFFAEVLRILNDCGARDNPEPARGRNR